MSDQTRGVSARAERVLLSHAEAYRLFEEARQMRTERDLARTRVGALEAVLRGLEWLPAPMLDGRIRPVCPICGWPRDPNPAIRRLNDLRADGHAQSCQMALALHGPERPEATTEDTTDDAP